jgi:hypothetical protein
MEDGTCFDPKMPLTSHAQETCLKFSTEKPNLLAISDSHAAAMTTSLLSTEFNLLRISETRMPPLLPEKNAKGGVSYIFNSLIPQRHRDINVMLLISRWKNMPLNNIGKTRLHETIDYLERYNLTYYFVGPPTIYTIPYPKAKQLKSKYINADGNKINDFIREIIPASRYIEIIDVNFTDNCEGSVCKDYHMYDTDHLTVYGTEQLREYLSRFPGLELLHKEHLK